MPNADMTRFMNNAKLQLPGALDATIQLEMFNVMNDFFQGSNAWLEDIAVKVTPSSTTYDVIPADTGVINRLMWIMDSNKVQIKGTMSEPGTLVLVFAPTVSGTYTVTVAKTVTDPTTREGFPDFPDWVLNKYGTDLLNGLLGRMMAQPAKPYTSQTLAIYYMKRFASAVSKARTEALHQNIYGGQTWRFPQAFAGRHK